MADGNGRIVVVWNVVGLGGPVDLTDRDTGERIQGRRVHFVAAPVEDAGGSGHVCRADFIRLDGLIGEPKLGPARCTLKLKSKGVGVASVEFGAKVG